MVADFFKKIKLTFMIANKSEMYQMARKILSEGTEDDVYFLCVDSNQLTSKIGVNLFEKLLDDVTFDNVTCSRSLTVTKEGRRKDCILIECLLF